MQVCSVVRCFSLFSNQEQRTDETCSERKSVSVVWKAFRHGGIMRCRTVLMRRRRVLLGRLASGVHMLRRDIRPLAGAVSWRPLLFNAKFKHLEHVVRIFIKAIEMTVTHLCTDNVPLALLPVLVRLSQRLNVALLPVSESLSQTKVPHLQCSNGD